MLVLRKYINLSSQFISPFSKWKREILRWLASSGKELCRERVQGRWVKEDKEEEEMRVMGSCVAEIVIFDLPLFKMAIILVKTSD